MFFKNSRTYQFEQKYLSSREKIQKVPIVIAIVLNLSKLTNDHIYLPDIWSISGKYIYIYIYIYIWCFFLKYNDILQNIPF